MPSSPRLRRRRAETWFWTGPVGHLLGGGLDFLQALGRYALMRYGPRRARLAKRP